ncbi:hypothetical protein ScPMuIL_017504, partial [Solemya velum]
QDIYLAISIFQNTDSDILLGPMRLKQPTMSIMLVFAKEDAQSDGFWWAADRVGYKCNITRNPEGALECYLDKHHDVVIIDNRHHKNFDAETLCRSIRATKASDHTVLVAVNKKCSTDREEPSILPLLKAGFNKRYTENPNIGACLNELLSLEYTEVRSQLKLRACNALFTALDQVSDAVEIANEDNEIQYVNPAYERLTGYSNEEVIGKDCNELQKNEKNLQESINCQLKKGKFWEGTFYTRRKSGDVIPHICHTCPVLGPGGKQCFFVSVKRSSDTSQHFDRLKDSTEFCPIANGGVHGIPRRRESVTRIHSVTIEAPITKVINIISAAQENSPLTVVQALDKVLEILQTSELYSPYFGQPIKDDDPITSDLVGGLVSIEIRLLSKNKIYYRKLNHPHSHIPTSPHTTSQVPQDVQTILDKEPCWDLRIIELEKVTNKRTLLFLGMKILNRFRVCEFLNVSEVTMSKWLQKIEANYHSSNSYHNSTHAADVLHASAYFLERERCKTVFDKLDEVTCLLAAIVHDLDHPGRTNPFLVNSCNDLALLYNDLAVLESHHVALAFRLTTRDSSLNIFQNLERDDFRYIRQSIIDMVLATEMMKHFEHLNKFVNSINRSAMKQEEASSMSGNGSPDSAAVITQLSTPENKLLIKRMLIKCADVSNPTRPLDMCKEWAKRIANEYCSQTDEERERNLPVVMPVFDRKTISIPKSQTSFIDVFINDMFDAWDSFCDIPELMTHLQNNYTYWKELEEKLAKAKEEEEDETKKEDEKIS